MGTCDADLPVELAATHVEFLAYKPEPLQSPAFIIRANHDVVGPKIQTPELHMPP